MHKVVDEVNGVAKVTFSLPAAVDAHSADIVGEFTGWVPVPMTHTSDGGFSVSVELPMGRAYRFRYLLDGVRWENDWHADDYVLNVHGSHDSVVIV